MALTHNSEGGLQNRGTEEEEVRRKACPCVKHCHKSLIKMKLKYTSKQETFCAHLEPRTPLQCHIFCHWTLAEWSVLGQTGNQATYWKKQLKLHLKSSSFPQKSEAVRLEILLAMYLCRAAVVKIRSQRVLHLSDRLLPSLQLGRKAAEYFVSLDLAALGKD